MSVVGYGFFEAVIVATGLIAALYWYTKPRAPKGYKLPPGPKGLPLVGNVNLLSKFYDPLFLEKLKNQYGDIMSIEVLGTRIVVVNSSTIARDLFEKRSAIYSDRPPHYAATLLGFSFNFGIMGYGDRWRRHRRLFHQYFNSKASEDYASLQMHAMKDLLRKLYQEPDDFFKHMEYISSFIILKTVYDYDVQERNDEYVNLVLTVMESLGASLNQGSFLIDFLPSLKYIPAWFPGGEIQKKAKIWREPSEQLVTYPFDLVKRRMAAGKAGPSITAACLKQLHANPNVHPDDEEIIMNATAAAYLGGALTTLGALLVAILALAMHTDVQKKAQEELDLILGDRLPVLEDRSQLPYVNAFCDETHRWVPGVPFGVAHAVTEDDIYGDIFIPKGSVVFGNIRTMLRDETSYGPDIEEFRPERFLKPEVNPPTVQYGFGRRICPGRYFASNTLFLAAATILKVFEITPVKDENGKYIPITPKFTNGAFSTPEPFPCSIKPRSALAEKIILKAIATAE